MWTSREKPATTRETRTLLVYPHARSLTVVRQSVAILPLRSRITTDGIDRAPHRAFMRGMGLDDAAIAHEDDAVDLGQYVAEVMRDEYEAGAF